MSKPLQLDFLEYKKILSEVTNIPVDTRNWFHPRIADWIQYHATMLGVPDTYIGFPIIASVAYCSQHATVSLDDGTHSEPVLIYGLVGGRSGTNKSAALKKVTDIVFDIKNPNGGHLFDTGTLEGLMKGMQDNNGCILSANDEFASFNDSFEKSSSSNLERSRFLSLYSCSNWQRITKNSGCYTLEDPRFNLIAFTQPYYAANFAKNYNTDGFFQRFLISVPEEKFVTRKEKKDMMKTQSLDNVCVDMRCVLESIFINGSKRNMSMVLCSDAEELYEQYHDCVVEFRRENLYDETRVSVMSKSLGLAMRLSGVMCLFRNAMMSLEVIGENEEAMNNSGDYDMPMLVTKADFEMALNLTKYSVQTSFALLPPEKPRNGTQKKSEPKAVKIPVPDPENFTMDYAVSNQKLIKRYLNVPNIPLSLVTRDKLYPIVNNVQGAHVGTKFVNGLQSLGLGVLSPQ